MFNMTVAEAHTYVVGDGEWVVHNACPTGKRANFRKETKEALSELYDGLPCPYCGRLVDQMDIEHIEAWDEIKALAKTRADEIEIFNAIDNLAKACASCNRSKQNQKLLLWLLKRLEK